MTMSATTRIHAIQAPSFDMERRDLNNMNAHIQVSHGPLFDDPLICIFKLKIDATWK